MGLTFAFRSGSSKLPVYIDPTNVASGRNGTIGNPYNSFVESGIVSNTTYKLKSNTTLSSTTPLDLANTTNVFITSYEEGDRPIFHYQGGGTSGVNYNSTVSSMLANLDIMGDLNKSIMALIQSYSGTNNTIYNCKVHNIRQIGPDGMGIRGGGTNWKILNCDIYDCGADGMYLVGNTNLEVGYCNIHHVNQDYAGAERGFRSIGMSAPGDGIQLDGNWSNYHIHHTTIDRTDAWTGNKYCLIQSSAPTSNTNSYGLIEYCTFKTRADNNVGWGIFAGFGDGITYRYNTFFGKTAGIRVAGPASKNYLIHHNVFKECTSGVGIAYNEGSPLNTRVFNNTFYKCSLRGIWVDRTTVIARNNIYYPDGAGGVGLHSYGGVGVSITQSNCCFENQETIGNGGQGDNAIIGNPLLVDVINNDFHLQAGSPCMGAGVDVGLTEDYYGAAIPTNGIFSIGVSDGSNVTPDTAVYIDPTNVASGRNGTISNPYNSFVESGLLDSTTYKVKSGTTLTTSAVLDLSYRTDTFITSYGVGAKPIFNFTASGTCAIRFALSTRCTLDGLEVTTPLTNSLVTLINGGINTGLNGGTDNWITNCKLHNVKQGSGDGGMGIRAGGTNWKIVGCEFYNIGCDGMYLSDVPNLFVNNCNLYLINQNYAGASKGFVSIGNGASGDGIQLGGNYDNFYIGNTTIDRSDAYTGNKFCIIFNSGNPLAETCTGVVEHCTFKTNSSTAYAIDHVMGTGVIFRYNKFNGSTVGVKLEGALVHDTLFHHNIFVGCTNPIRIGSTYSGTLGPATGTKVYNNVFYGSLGAGTALSDITLDQTHVDSCNNIHYNTNSAMSAIHNYGSGVIDRKSNNCYYGGITSGFGGDGVNPVTGNPLFVDAANGDFHLQAGSSCRNSGIDVGLIEDYYGITIPQETVTAIGAAEYNI